MFIYFLIVLFDTFYICDMNFSNFKWTHDLFSISDLHGDMDSFIKILLNEQIIDKDNNILKENVLIVITGDILDPNYDDINIVFFIEGFNEKGKDKNSSILLILGNHEVKNLCLDFNKKKKDSNKYNSRNKLFKKNEKIYNYLIKNPFVVKVNDIIFSHAGVLPFYSSYGINFINEEGKKEIENNCELLKEKKKKKEELCICCEYGPTLNRYYSYISNNIFKKSKVCSTLIKSLKLLKSNKMVIGHTVQKNKKVNSFCEGKLLLADTAISKWKKGVISYVQYFKNGTYNVKYIER
ncbi:shewanella-like protein phosphatase 2, putative [Plasmodium gallinaceum]|uniref:Shewanella-like protein phosphatase 2, putative n=1 Tax=Plasmodium gallinaceum TaxID=5849 RepID=A0A1J1GUM7_PLAGA|nr:shewanella-like protein phosphatase 2, putative [Plasmodium gallinaceum]CRG95947.1 shewanella-like protein phosphatase 2, putative [Plasmodium gallinaceum]